MKIISIDDLQYLDEVDILYPKPKKVRIGESYIIIKELPLNTLEMLKDEFIKLTKKVPSLLGMEIPQSLKELKDLKENDDKFNPTFKLVCLLLRKKKFRKQYIRILKLIMPEIDSRGFITSKYIMQTLTETEAIQILTAVFAYNFTSDIKCKKKVQEMAKEIIKL